MYDFTLTIYDSLIQTLIKQGFSILAVEEFVTKSTGKLIILRHDVDSLPENSLKLAHIQARCGIKGTYYFRIVPQSYNRHIIKEINSLGHEIGYHYETMDTSLGDIEKAYYEFCHNLDKIRQIVPIKTVCMHGSPFSKFDNRLIWRKYDYRELGITFEPYFDVNFAEVYYLTDTGRRWDGGEVSIRDKGLGIRDRERGVEFYKDWKVKPESGSLMNMTQQSFNFQSKYKFSSTSEIIMAADKKELPDKIMMTFHPQRWTDKPIPWLKELIWQNVKNVGKYFLIKLRD